MLVKDSLFLFYPSICAVEENICQEEIVHRIEGQVVALLRNLLKNLHYAFVRPSPERNLETRNGVKYLGLATQVPE